MIYPGLKINAVLTVSCLAILTASCGRSEQKVRPKTSSSTTENEGESGKGPTGKPAAEAAKDPSCLSAEKCPAVNFTIVDETGVVPVSKAAKIGSPVKWSFKVQSSAVAGRLLIAEKQFPSWATIAVGSSPGSKEVAGTPNEANAQGELIFIVRDMIKCKVTEKESSVCSDVDKNLPYDKIVTIKYTVSTSGAAAPAAKK